MKLKIKQVLIELTESSKHKLTAQTRRHNQTTKCLQISSLAGETRKILPRPRFNCCKGLIRLKQFGVDDMEDFKDQLQEQHYIETIEKATFIKSRHDDTSYIITFKQEVVPYSVNITDTVVFPFN